jgi:1L-myo-inositol 1-phosphate cytidylyltransferase
MLRFEIREAVVLAAGNGSRMASFQALPKPLTPVGGMKLLARVLAGLPPSIQKVHIVIGYQGDQLRSAFGSQHQGRAIEWIYNPFFHLPNGVSLSLAEGRVASPFLLVMSDHLFELGLLNRFCLQECPVDGGILAIDRKIDLVFDLPDAMKVELNGEHVLSLGKQREKYQAIDTGAFLLSHSVFDAFRKSHTENDLSLAGAIQRLASNSRMHTWDIGPARWIDVDTPEALAEAERLLEAGCFWNGAEECEQYCDVIPTMA